MKVLVIGGGAMGCLWGANLSKSGQEVLFLETDPIRYQALYQQGGVVYGAKGEEELYAAAVASSLEEVDLSSVDGVMIAVKAYDVDRVLARLLPLVSLSVPVLILANGAGFGERQAFSSWRGQIFFAVSFQGAYLSCPGQVEPRGMGNIFWGSMPLGGENIRENAEAHKTLAWLLTSFPACTYTSHFPREMWQKLLVNSIINPLTALWQIPNGGLKEALLTESQRQPVADLFGEGLAVAQAFGKYRLGRNDFLQGAEVWSAYRHTVERTAANHSSMYLDVCHRRQTEIDYINGYIIAQGKKLGVATPTQEQVYQEIKACLKTGEA